MHSLYANLLNETEKLWRQRRTKGFLLLALILPVVTVLLSSLLKIRAGMLFGLEGSLPVAMLHLFTFAIIPLYMAAAAAHSFAGEVAARTMKLVLLRPVTRARAYASKVIAIAVFAALCLGVLWIASTVSAWAVGGSAGGMADSLKAYAASFVPMMAIGLVCVFIAQLFSSGTSALMTIVLIYAAAKALPLLLPQLSAWSVFSYTRWDMLWTGSGAPAGTLLNTFLLLLSYIIMAYAAGLMMFARKQL